MTKDSKPRLFQSADFRITDYSWMKTGNKYFCFFSALRRLMQRTPWANAARCNGTCTALHHPAHHSIPSHSTPFHHRKNRPTHIAPARFLIRNSSFSISRQPNSKFIIHHSKLKRSELREYPPCRNFAPETQGRNTYETENRNPDPTAR